MVLADSHRISPVPWYSGISLGHSSYTYRAITFYGTAFQAVSISTSGPVMQALQPRYDRNHIGLGYSPFARRYLGNHYCFLFLRVLRCFSSPGSLYIPMYSVCSDRSSTCRVAPFGNPRINARLQLPVAYRSLSRPSSPIHAKASAIRPYLLKLRHFTWTELTPFDALMDSLLFFFAIYALRNNHHVKEHFPGGNHSVRVDLPGTVELAGIEPATPCLQSRCSTI
jgi:hypothetical protein